MRDIGKNIKTIRTQKSMTQDELAEKLFVIRQSVSNYETGRSRPDVQMLMKIAEALEVDMQELLYEPVSAGERKKRVLWVLGIAVCNLLLGIAVYWGIGRTSEYASQTYHLLPNIIMGIFVRPAYFLLLGISAAVCCRLLANPRPVNPKLAKGVRWGVAAFVLFYLLCQLPWIFSRITFPGFWFRLCIWFARIGHSHFWIYLIPGGALGLCWNLQPKKSSDD